MTESEPICDFHLKFFLNFGLGIWDGVFYKRSICNIYAGKVLCYVLYALAVRKACESAATDGMGGGE